MCSDLWWKRHFEPAPYTAVFVPRFNFFISQYYIMKNRDKECYRVLLIYQLAASLYVTVLDVTILSCVRTSKMINGRNEGDIINIVKVAARKSILMQIHSKSQTGKWIPLDKIQGCHINALNNLFRCTNIKKEVMVAYQIK
jgi:hypothetical protein